MPTVTPPRPSSPFHLPPRRTPSTGQGAGEKGAYWEKLLHGPGTALQLILMAPEKLLCKGSSAIPRAICIIKYRSCLDSNSFRFSSYTVSRMRATLKRQKLSAKIHFHQSSYWRTRGLFMFFHITEYLSQLQLWAFLI